LDRVLPEILAHDSICILIGRKKYTCSRKVMECSAEAPASANMFYQILRNRRGRSPCGTEYVFLTAEDAKIAEKKNLD
jgi:hypothetical protein